MPIEQTKLATATTGPTSGPHSMASSGWSTRNTDCQKLSGTQAPIAPAMPSPSTMSRSTAAHSITKMWLTAVNPFAEPSRRHTEPPSVRLMSMAAWPSMDPARPRSAWVRAAASRPGRRNARNSSASTGVEDDPRSR